MVSQSRRTVPSAEWCWWASHGRLMSSPGPVIKWKRNMKQTQTIPETFLGVGYTRDRAGLPLEAVRVPVPRPTADQVLIRGSRLAQMIKGKVLVTGATGATSYRRKAA